MTGRLERHELVLAIFPSSRGLGWVAFEGPFSPYDWGTLEPKADKNRRCARGMERIVERLRPTTVVLEAYEPPAPRWPRVAELCEELARLAEDMGAELAVYDRAAVRECFSHLGASTRYGVAQAVARLLPALAPKLPPARKAWETEQANIALFNAAALTLTHFAARTRDVLDELKARCPADNQNI